ncbi:hypothetical protein ASD11_09140 [Aeromicrobium sp. Root495]|uniref:hypothetical protein n=1 Tax=Aeromicrobium sp. Root495 TaxID=1736550 RepID=UPI0006F55729|nr:hypothetical protein [Aeromicrobium sp. Root495]KQY59697.1 hypothetical protein ASD11_09140 [Aeromicrobium sp. Root495]
MSAPEVRPAQLRLQRDPRRRLVQVLAVLLGIALLLVAVLTWRLVGTGGQEAAEREASKVARQRAVQITTYTPSTYERDVAWAEAGATPAFAEEYARANAPLKKVVTKVKASAQGDVVAASASARDDDHVTVLLFVDQTVTQGATGKQMKQDSRVEMDMVRRDGRWLVDDVNLR